VKRAPRVVHFPLAPGTPPHTHIGRCDNFARTREDTMIPARFEYHRPADVASALALLGELGDEARVIAGGHSLIPMMKLRMAAISHLIDLQDIADLKGIRIDGTRVTIGAMTTQHELIEHDGLARVAPILREAALQIADPQVRYMGTVGGNVANGDPGNDMPGLMQCARRPPPPRRPRRHPRRPGARLLRGRLHDRPRR
jgi:xanthine dehydrogenase iron-sulfur cluster and FAD-binding subunit A